MSTKVVSRSRTSSRGRPQQSLVTPDQYRQWIKDSPDLWAEKIYGVQIWDKQTEILRSTMLNRRTAVKGCVASSKTMAAGLVVHAFLQAFAPAKVFSTAPSARQVDGVLWGEVRAMHAASAVPLGGDLKPVASEWRFGPNWFALGFTSNDPNRFHGWHGPNVLFIVDEAQGIDPQTFAAIENVMADGRAHLLYLMNPSCIAGEAYDAFHSKRSAYNCISIAAKDTPNYKAKKIVIPGMITYDQAEEWKALYGEESDFYRVKVLAEFPRQEADTLIALDWCEKAIVRTTPSGPLSLGVDVARFGDDKTVLQPVFGRQVHAPTAYQGFDLMQTVGQVKLAMAADPLGRAQIDEIGMGGGVVDRAHELKLHVTGVNVAEKARDEERFANRRSELWWAVRERLDPRNPLAWSLPNHPGLIADLSSVKYKVDSAGRIAIEPKDKTKERLGRSPDFGDALCMAAAGDGRAASSMSAGNFFSRPAQPDWA